MDGETIEAHLEQLGGGGADDVEDLNLEDMTESDKEEWINTLIRDVKGAQGNDAQATIDRMVNDIEARTVQVHIESVKAKLEKAFEHNSNAMELVKAHGGQVLFFFDKHEILDIMRNTSVCIHTAQDIFERLNI